jgi:hypothetical protein
MSVEGLLGKVIKTTVFDKAPDKFQNLSELAAAMGISVSQVYRVREGKRSINEKFIIGAKMAFPELRLDDLFYLEDSPSPRRLKSPQLTASTK